MIHINNRSDFSIVWKMPNGGILPTFTYTLEFSTRGGLRYAVKSDDESRFIPKSDADGQIRSAVIVFDFSNRPHLPSGRLSFTMKAAIPNTMYPDDYQDITEPHPTNAELWDGATDYKDAIEVELVLPYVKGDKGDAGEGVPAGGRTGQVLKKKSDGDYDTTWGDDEGITDIAPGAVGTKEIADNAVTESKLTKGVRDNINGKLNKTEISTEPTASTVIRRDDNGRAKVATPEADNDIANKHYVDAQKIKEPEKAGNFVVLDVKGMPTPSDYKPESFRKASDKIQTNDIAEKAVMLPNLGDDVVAKLNGYASKEDVVAVANVATSAASAAADAQTSADYAANAAIAAGSIAQTAKETAESAQTAADGAVRYDAAQELTSAQQSQTRTNIDAMANTPSGDPMHYIYETAGAEWIPYADISTEGLEDWQVATLDRAQAQADNGVWWHNDIFVTVEQNRINYILTIGQYPSQLNTYDLYLGESFATTNYKDKHSGFYTLTANDALRFCKCVTVYFPNVSLQSAIRFCQLASNIRRILGIVNITQISQPNGLNDAFQECPNLEDVSIKGINANLNLSKCPNLRTSSVIYMITNAGTATLTITLASAVYAAAMEDTAVQAALASKPNVTLAYVDVAGSSGAN